MSDMARIAPIGREGPVPLSSSGRLPLVSVVLCVFNERDFVRDAIESVFSQTYPNTELIIVDNGSTDGTADIVGTYRSERVRILYGQRNAAVTKRLNQGIAAAKGDFVSILYGDDYYLPTKIARQVEAFAALASDFGVVYGPGYRLNVFTGARFVEARLNLSGPIFEQLLVARKAFMSPISPLVRRACFLQHPFDEDIYVEGENIFLRIALDWKFLYIDEPLVVMRDHTQNIGHAVAKMAEYQLLALDHLEREPSFPRHLSPKLNFVRAATLENVGWWAIRIACDPEKARSAFARAIRRRSVQLLHPRTLVGLALSLLPVAVLRRLNSMANSLRRHRVNLEYQADHR